MKSIPNSTSVYLFLLLLCLGPHSLAWGQCAAVDWSPHSCTSTNETVSFALPNLPPPFFQISQDLFDTDNNLLGLSTYTVNNPASCRFVSDWSVNSTGFFAFDGSNLVFSQTKSLLQDAGYSDIGSHTYDIYGPPLDPDQPGETYSHVSFGSANAGSPGESPGSIFVSTFNAAVPANGSIYKPLTFYDVVSVHYQSIFSIAVTGAGEDNCQSYAYKITIEW